MTSFRTLITSHPGLTEELPLIHTSRCEFLSSMATTHALEPQPCGVFHESLVYLFYRRPAYRSNHGSMGGEPIVLCPVCFVFKRARFHRWFIVCIRATLAQLQQIVLPLRSEQATWPNLPWLRRSIVHAVWSA